MAPLKTILINIQRLVLLALSAVLISFVIISCWDTDLPSLETDQSTQATLNLSLAASAMTATATATTPPLPALADAPAASAADPITQENSANQNATGAIGSIAPTTVISDASQTLLLTSCSVPLHLDLAGVPEQESLTTRLGCPTAQASLEQVAINEFGKGPEYNRFMLWFSTGSQIYVLFADNTWLKYTDSWREGEPEISCNPTRGPRTTPPLPHRGFGKLWCTVDDIRLKLGEIDRKERLCQHSVTQRFEAGYLLACFEDATIRYFQIFDTGTWQMSQVQ